MIPRCNLHTHTVYCDGSNSVDEMVEAAINAGLDTCWYNPDGREVPPDIPVTYVIERLEDVVPLILGD